MPLYWVISIFMCLFIIISMIGFYMIYSKMILQEIVSSKSMIVFSWSW